MLRYVKCKCVISQGICVRVAELLTFMLLQAVDESEWPGSQNIPKAEPIDPTPASVAEEASGIVDFTPSTSAASPIFSASHAPFNASPLVSSSMLLATTSNSQGGESEASSPRKEPSHESAGYQPPTVDDSLSSDESVRDFTDTGGEYFVISKKKLLELFRVCPTCHGLIDMHSISSVGSAAKVTIVITYFYKIYFFYITQFVDSIRL